MYIYIGLAKIVREIWRVSCSPHQLISRLVAVTFETNVLEIPGINDIVKGLKHTSTGTPTPPTHTCMHTYTCASNIIAYQNESVNGIEPYLCHDMM